MEIQERKGKWVEGEVPKECCYVKEEEGPKN